MATGADKYKVAALAEKLGLSPQVLGAAACRPWFSSLLTQTGRLMKHIAAMGDIKETGVDEYAPTNFSSALAVPVIGEGYPCL